MDFISITADICKIAEEAGAFLKQTRGEITSDDVEIKGQGDFVSYADREAERILRSGLEKLVPGSVVMAEEESPNARGGEFRWIVDPLDGTSNYLMGLPVYAVSVALEDRRKNPDGFGPIVAGVVHLPVLKTTYSAWQGGGAWKNGEQIHVATQTDTIRMLFATAFPYRNRREMSHYLNVFRTIYPEIADFRRIGSAAADLAWVADGTFDGYFEMGLKPWDVAAGKLLVQEAGGVVTDWWGGELLRTGWVVAGSEAAYRFQRSAIDSANVPEPSEVWR